MTGIVIAYDKSQLTPADEAFLASVAPRVSMVKFGLQSLTALRADSRSVGHAAGDHVRLAGGQVFEDWKLHDIGNTMREAAKNLAGTVDAFTVHLSASENARIQVREACSALRTAARSTLILGVSVLTDISDEECEEIYGTKRIDKVCQFVQNCHEAGFDGFVCSGRELGELRRRGLVGSLKPLVPGTRSPGADTHDQRNVVTHREAAELGAAWIVAGREVSQAHDPHAALAAIEQQLGI